MIRNFHIRLTVSLVSGSNLKMYLCSVATAGPRSHIRAGETSIGHTEERQARFLRLRRDKQGF